MLHLIITIALSVSFHQQPANLDLKMQEYNLVVIRELNNNIVVDLKYSTTDNFVPHGTFGNV